MEVLLFRADDPEYQKWLKASLKGYVVNTQSNMTFNTVVLHRASCLKVQMYDERMAHDAFTGQKSIKLCCRELDPLRGWLKRRGVKGFSHPCKLCDPLPPK